MINVQPITTANDWPQEFLSNYRKSTRRASFWKWLLLLTESEYVALDREVESRLKERTLSIEEAWIDYPQYMELVRKVQEFLSEKLWGFKPIFIPEDSYDLIGQLLTGDLGEVEMIMAVEEEFDFEFDEEFFHKNISMYQFIEYIDTHKS